MVLDAAIRVHHLTRVEGHGDIVVEIEDGRLTDARFPVVEAPRLFEAFLRGHRYDEVTHMAPRVCGICSISHKCAALKATETALGIEISEQTLLLRKLAFLGEVMSSHVLHVCFLALPDFLGVPSVFPLVSSNPDLVLQAMRLKKLGYDLCAAVAGRHTHPIGMVVGGFSFVHSEEELAVMKSRLGEGIEDVKKLVQFFRTISLPQFERETQYVSLRHPDHYAFYEGDVYSGDGVTYPVSTYRDVLHESVVPYSTAKHARWNGSHYMVGALARFNNNHAKLSPLARQAAADMALTPPNHNPFMNTVAQIVELAHCMEEGIRIIDTLLSNGIKAQDELVQADHGQGSGVGVVEAPRGTLFHEYSYDQNGLCTEANLVIPTAQNLENLEADMREFVPGIIDRTEDAITHQLEMLVRAYDPCISCSTHVVKLDDYV